MLVNAKDMLLKARDGHYAVAQININNLEWAKAVLETVEATKTPVILGVSEGAAKYMGGFDVVVALVTALDK
ncbi:MAG: fructose-bisphosphate aldolase, partial [Clostridiales bacterium]|nr:fructose-bisphosphate aldolase [Clostridiales bacterium]